MNTLVSAGANRKQAGWVDNAYSSLLAIVRVLMERHFKTQTLQRFKRVQRKGIKNNCQTQ